MQTDDLAIKVQTLNGAWATLGAGSYRGVAPEDVVLTANQWGSDTASFMLRRDPGAIPPDLYGWTPAEVEVGGVVVWAGRIKETPSREGADYGVAVTGAGWQYHLDNDLYMQNYVHAGLSEWKDTRSFSLSTDLTKYVAAPQVANDRGVIVLSWPNGAIIPQNAAVAVTIDLGPNSLAARVTTDWDSVNLAPATNFYALGVGHSTPAPPAPANNLTNSFLARTFASGGQPSSATDTNTLTTPSRYLTIMLGWQQTVQTNGSDASFRIKAVRIYSNAAYESGGASILKAPVILKDALTYAPLLSQDTSQIDPGGTITFNIPEFGFGTQPQTPREAIDQANVFHDYQPFIDMQKRLAYRPRPAVALFEAGSWAGSQFSDTSMNSTEEIFNNALVTGSAPDGAFLAVRRTVTGTLADRQGAFKSTKHLPIESAVTTAVLNQLGDIYLGGHSKTPFKGDLSVWPGGVRRVIGGGSVHPSALLLAAGELLRLNNRVDPDTGALGRDGRLDHVTYTHNERRAEAGLDNSRKNFEAFVQRLSALTAGIALPG